MSIYNHEKFQLPQVKIIASDKNRLFSFLKIFHRKYADFVRDLCDANIQWGAQDINWTFEDHAGSVAREISKRYRENHYKFFSSKKDDGKKISIVEQLSAHEYPYPREIVRLPVVTVSKWQADNLHHFLSKYGRNFADFIRLVLENIYIDTIEAQCGNPAFTECVEQIFNRVFDEMVGARKLMRGRYTKKQWPTGYWTQRHAIKSRNRSLGINR